MSSASLAVLLVSCVLVLSSCERETRLEGRRRRLDTFRASLPDSVMTCFDMISGSEDCHAVGLMLEEARNLSADLSDRLDSIAHAELIDTFTDVEMVYYFWYYFDYAIETGSVRGP